MCLHSRTYDTRCDIHLLYILLAQSSNAFWANNAYKLYEYIYIGKKCTENYSQNLNWENNRETRARKRIILKPILMDQIIWLRTESTSGILWTMWWNRVFFCRRLAERLSASQEWVCKQTRFLEYFESFAICDSYDMPFDVMNCEIWIVC